MQECGPRFTRALTFAAALSRGAGACVSLYCVGVAAGRTRCPAAFLWLSPLAWSVHCWRSQYGQDGLEVCRAIREPCALLQTIYTVRGRELLAFGAAWKPRSHAFSLLRTRPPFAMASIDVLVYHGYRVDAVGDGRAGFAEGAERPVRLAAARRHAAGRDEVCDDEVARLIATNRSSCDRQDQRRGHRQRLHPALMMTSRSPSRLRSSCCASRPFCVARKRVRRPRLRSSCDVQDPRAKPVGLTLRGGFDVHAAGDGYILIFCSEQYDESSRHVLLAANTRDLHLPPRERQSLRAASARQVLHVDLTSPASLI